MAWQLYLLNILPICFPCHLASRLSKRVGGSECWHLTLSWKCLLRIGTLQLFITWFPAKAISASCPHCLGSKKWSFPGLFPLHSHCCKIMFFCVPLSSVPNLLMYGYIMWIQSFYDSFSRAYRLPLCRCHTFIYFMFATCISNTCWDISCFKPWNNKNTKVICIYSLIRKYLENDRSIIMQGEYSCYLHIPFIFLEECMTNYF